MRETTFLTAVVLDVEAEMIVKVLVPHPELAVKKGDTVMVLVPALVKQRA